MIRGKEKVLRKTIALLCSFNILLQLFYSFPAKGKTIFAQEVSAVPAAETTDTLENKTESGNKVVEGLIEITNLIFERAGNTPVQEPSPAQSPLPVITEISSPFPTETISLPTQIPIIETVPAVQPTIIKTPSETPIVIPTPTLILIDPKNTVVPLPTATSVSLPAEESTGAITPQITLPTEKPSEAIIENLITPTPTPTAIVSEKICLEEQTINDSLIENWEIDDGNKSAQTKEPVNLGIKYIFPIDKSVTVTFKCLPKDESLRTPLKITQLKISDLKLPPGTITDGEYAYDITTGMKDGEFEYDITLPKSTDKKEVEVVYIDKNINEATNTPLTEKELKTVLEDKTEGRDFILVENLNHFTIFLITGGKDSTNLLFPVILDSSFSQINSSDDIYYEAKGTWPIYWILDFQKNQFMEFSFSPNIPEGAVINNVKIVFEYQRGPFRLGSTQRDARMRAWNGINFDTEIAGYSDLLLSTYNQDETKIINVPISLVNTPEKINNFKFRFFMRGEGPLNDCGVPTNIKTKHDLIALDVDYTLPNGTITPTPTLIPTETPTPSLTGTPSPTPTEIPVYSRIGDLIWNDINDNNIQDSGETGIPEVTVKAYEDDGDGVFEPSLDFLRANQTTDVNGNYYFDNLPAGVYFIYADESSLPDGGSGYDLSQGGSNPFKISVAEEEINLSVDFGFAPPAKISLIKSNDKLSASIGEIVTYTLKIKTGERVLSSMTLVDNLPEGFIYQSDSSGVNGGTIVSVEPNLSNNNKTLTWNWSSVPSYGEVVVTYQTRIDQANQAASYTNYAWVKGKGSPRTVQSDIVESTVIIGASYSFSTQAGENKVLGASTEGEVLGAILPAAGSETGYTVLAFGMIITGIILDNKKSKRRKK